MQNINTCLPPNEEYGNDEYIVLGLGNGVFFIRDMYMALANFDEENMDDLWGDIWNLNVPEGIKYFMWILAHNILLTNFSKSRKGWGHTIYNLCYQVSEIAMHIV